MQRQLRELKELADDAGVTVDDLMTEMEQGASVTKPFTIAVSFDRMADMMAFAKRLTEAMTGVAVYRADSLDPEYGGRGGGNRFVIRSANGLHGKPDTWRVDSTVFDRDGSDFD